MPTLFRRDGSHHYNVQTRGIEPLRVSLVQILEPAQRLTLRDIANKIAEWYWEYRLVTLYHLEDFFRAVPEQRIVLALDGAWRAQDRLSILNKVGARMVVAPQQHQMWNELEHEKPLCDAVEWPANVTFWVGITKRRNSEERDFNDEEAMRHMLGYDPLPKLHLGHYLR